MSKQEKFKTLLLPGLRSWPPSSWWRWGRARCSRPAAPGSTSSGQPGSSRSAIRSLTVLRFQVKVCFALHQEYSITNFFKYYLWILYKVALLEVPLNSPRMFFSCFWFNFFRQSYKWNRVMHELKHLCCLHLVVKDPVTSIPNNVFSKCCYSPIEFPLY